MVAALWRRLFPRRPARPTPHGERGEGHDPRPICAAFGCQICKDALVREFGEDWRARRCAALREGRQW